MRLSFIYLVFCIFISGRVGREWLTVLGFVPYKGESQCTLNPLGWTWSGPWRCCRGSIIDFTDQVDVLLSVYQDCRPGGLLSPQFYPHATITFHFYSMPYFFCEENYDTIMISPDAPRMSPPHQISSPIHYCYRHLYIFLPLCRAWFSLCLVFHLFPCRGPGLLSTNDHI